jgi:hypothetical protein
VAIKGDLLGQGLRAGKRGRRLHRHRKSLPASLAKSSPPHFGREMTAA